ncbi:type II toxin-antitoxin system Phd/YefM family antitoxin [Actinomadura viridis]|uniref:type II toxin-antitoxin system Phd/YefM family antitoxin n=1 Tax=Actinomadura viridis TaxID=58110 RepID=UPI0036CDCF16
MDAKESLPTSEARANLSDVIASVRLLRRCIYLTRRDKPQAALVPVELADAAVEAGGADPAAQILRDHIAAMQKK